MEILREGLQKVQCLWKHCASRATPGIVAVQHEMTDLADEFLSVLPLRLTATAVAIDRSERRIVRDVSFHVESGQMLAITGPNGAGKSTLLRALAGLLPISAGNIICTGLPAEAVLPGHAHYLGHRDALKSALTARENLAFWAAMLALPGAGGLAPEAALARLALPQVADFPVSYLSAGQKRRVALARLLVAHRPVWLLDEPTTALDAASQQLVAGMIEAHLAKGGIVIAATHMELGVEGARELQLGGV